MKAKAVVFTKQNTVEFKHVDCPAPGPDDAVIRATYSWISNGTESSYLRGERIAGDTAYRPGDPIPFPLVPGYQKIGVVESVGENITDLTPGETVFSVIGMVNDMYYSAGGHISPSVTPRQHIWKLPAAPDPLAFGGMLLTQVGYTAGSRAPIEQGQHAMVIGDGLVGQWAAQTLAWRGAKVTMIGIDEHRMKLAEKLIGCPTINIKDTDWVKEVKKIAPDGVALVADTIGSRDMDEAMINLMVRGGNIVSTGFYGTNDKISLQAFRDNEITLYSHSGHTIPRMDKTMELITNGALQTLPLITHHFPVEKAADAWKVINSRTKPVLGVILDW